MSILILKQDYNKLLERYRKAEQFLENPKIEQTKKEQWTPEFVKITEQLSYLMRKYKELTGNEMLDENVLQGFK